jgi:hypothetical protein
VKYVMAFGGGRRGPATLEVGVSRETVAAECREAALELMAGVANGWTKVDLVCWLTGPYARATRHCQHGERTLVGEAAVRVPEGGLDPDTVEELLTTTRGRVLATLEKAALGDGSLDFADDLIERGLVRRARGDEGLEVWIPVDAARLRLKDRVGSLFVADYLNDPIAYGTLYVCHRCEAVVFDEDAREMGMCSVHQRLSGIVFRDGGPNDTADEEASKERQVATR